MNRQEKIDKIAKLDKGCMALFSEILKGDDLDRLVELREKLKRSDAEKHAILNTPVNED